MIEGILESSRRRGFKEGTWKPGKGRDLIASAKAIRKKGKTPIIAEIKPKIFGRPLSSEELAEYASLYAANDACAISVLTEPSHFMGSLDNVGIARETCLPVLRKDFIFDERQFQEVQADLVLLIASLEIDIVRFIDHARSLGMEPLVEVHTQEELERVLKTDAKIIGINNRNLKTLQVDLGTFERLAPMAKEAGVFLVAESGVHSREDARRMIKAGADAMLVGTALMERPEWLGELNLL